MCVESAIFANLSNLNEMNRKELHEKARSCASAARRVLGTSGIADIWRAAGCRVSLVGSLRMGLLASHRDIDLHVYSSGITVQSSFAAMARVADLPDVTEVKCINGLHTDEHCVAWHVLYRDADGAVWQFDIIHIEEGTRYDGYFEQMADRICAVMTEEQRDTILRLKFETPEGCGYHGVEYYEAVIAGGVSTFGDLAEWVKRHRSVPPYYWIP